MDQKEIALLGGTQGIGRQCLLLMLIKGLKVRVLARNPSMLSSLNEKYSHLLTIVKGDATREEDVAKLIAPSVDHVLCALGARLNEPTTIIESGVNNALKAMKKLDKEMRIVMVTSNGVLEAGVNWFYDNIMKKHLLNHFYDDMTRAEEALKQLTENSKISYAIVRPPQLIDAPATLELIHGEGEYYPHGTHLVTREDVGAFMIECLFNENLAKGNREFNLNTTKVLETKIDNMQTLKSIMPYPKYLMIRLFIFSVMTGIGSLSAFALYKIKSLLFPSIDISKIISSWLIKSLESNK